MNQMRNEYQAIKDLPDTLKEMLPEDAQETYLKAYSESWEDYKEVRGGELDREAVAHRDAMNVVTDEFILDQERGIWVHRDDYRGESDEQENRRGLIDQLTDQIREGIDEVSGMLK